MQPVETSCSSTRCRRFIVLLVGVITPVGLGGGYLIRAHLQKEADKFAVGDFSDPATIHGEQMPGLAELRSGVKRINIQYEPLPNGARLRYSTTDPVLVAALHKWFEAQRFDHHNHGGM